VVLDILDTRIDVYVENARFVEDEGKDTSIKNAQGYTCLGYIP